MHLSTCLWCFQGLACYFVNLDMVVGNPIYLSGYDTKTIKICVRLSEHHLVNIYLTL